MAKVSETMNENTVVTKVDVAFPLAGERVPLDHGYALFGALSRVLGNELHGAEWLAVHPIQGLPDGEKSLLLKRGRSALTLRLDAAQIPRVLPLAGKVLEVDGAQLVVGVPQVHALEPAETLVARLVVIKESYPRGEAPPARAWEDPARFEAAVRRQLDELAVSATIEPVRQDARRVLRVKDQTIVGFSMALHDLSGEHSIVVQQHGLGGRQRMGCGVFVPSARSR